MEGFTKMEFSFFNDDIKVLYISDTCQLIIKSKNNKWETDEEKAPFISINSANGKIDYSFLDFNPTVETFSICNERGLNIQYIFDCTTSVIEINIKIYIKEIGTNVYFEIDTHGDNLGIINTISFPAPFSFDALYGDGYTVIPIMQGMIIPAKWNKEIVTYCNGNIYDRDSSMPWFGQVNNGTGYMLIYETPYDANYILLHEVGGKTSISPSFKPSLGTMRYARKLSYSFFDECDYNKFCKTYKNYLVHKKKFVSLSEKIMINNNIKKLIGTPIVHETVCVHIDKNSSYYNSIDIMKNDYYKTFSDLSEKLISLKTNYNITRAYIHIDGWGVNGYDNNHPDILPPSSKAGGFVGLKNLKYTCENLGYLFALHDNYRNYFYSAENFSFRNAIKNIDSTYPFSSIWYGGEETLLCAKLAKTYIENNNKSLEDNGIKINGIYLDVFSAAELDECFNDEHLMSRENCAEYRINCLEYFENKEIISSSEETIDYTLKVMPLCHHSPYSLIPNPIGGEANGIPVPLVNLVFHDSVIIPWNIAQKHGGWGIPDNQSCFLHALLNGGTTYISTLPSEDELTNVNIVTALHERLALCEMVSHEFSSKDYNIQKTKFSDGTTIEVDFNIEMYTITPSLINV